MRLLAVRRLLAILFAAVVAVLLSAVVNSGAAHAATTIGPQATAFRTDAVRQLQAYETKVSDRLAPAELARVHGLITDAQRQLARLAVATKRLDEARPAQKAARKAAALAAYATARSSADAAIEEIQPLAVRAMGFGELLQAKADADEMLGRLDRLGSAIRSA